MIRRPTAGDHVAGAREWMRASGLVAALAIGGGILAACSSGSSSPTTTTAATPTSRSPVTTATTPASSSPTTAAGLARCATANLAGSIAGSSGAAGTIETTVALRNATTVPCTLGGYPGLQLIGSGGTALPTTVVRRGSYSFTAMPPTTVTLGGGESAYFNIGYSDVPVGGETSCPTSATLEVTPPNAFDHLVVTAALTPCGNGTLVVSPVFSATGSDSRTTAPGT